MMDDSEAGSGTPYEDEIHVQRRTKPVFRGRDSVSTIYIFSPLSMLRRTNLESVVQIKNSQWIRHELGGVRMLSEYPCLRHQHPIPTAPHEHQQPQSVNLESYSFHNLFNAVFGPC